VILCTLAKCSNYAHFSVYGEDATDNNHLLVFRIVKNKHQWSITNDT